MATEGVIVANRRTTRKQERRQALRLDGFLPLEARELCVLPKNTPALKLAREERRERRARFERIAERKIYYGKWRRSDVPHKWLQNISRMYSRRGWRVKYGPTPKSTTKLPKSSPNPWSLYRDCIRRTGGQGGQPWVSPWETRQIRRGKTLLQKGLLFVQQAEREAKSHGGLNRSQVKQWIDQKDEAIAKSRGQRKAQLVLEKSRLERLLK